MRDTRAALLDAAERLIRERGYAGVSYADLAGLVGVRKASIHHHFPGKADLALALLALKDGTVPAILSALDAPATSLRAAILARYRKAS